MCNCIREIQEKVSDASPKSAIEVDVEGLAWLEDFGFVTSTQFIARGKNSKPLKTFDIPHSFCPFCGEANDNSQKK